MIESDDKKKKVALGPSVPYKTSYVDMNELQARFIRLIST